MGLYGFNPVFYHTGENAATAFSIAQHFGYKGKLEEKTKLLLFLRTIPAHELTLYCVRYEKEVRVGNFFSVLTRCITIQ